MVSAPAPGNHDAQAPPMPRRHATVHVDAPTFRTRAHTHTHTPPTRARRAPTAAASPAQLKLRDDQQEEKDVVGNGHESRPTYVSDVWVHSTVAVVRDRCARGGRGVTSLGAEVGGGDAVGKRGPRINEREICGSHLLSYNPIGKIDRIRCLARFPPSTRQRTHNEHRNTFGKSQEN